MNWDEVYEAHYTSVMPKPVWDGLTELDRTRTERARSAPKGRFELDPVPWPKVVKALKSDFVEREGYGWLCMTTPSKYMLLQLGPPRLVAQWLAFDASRVDPFHEKFHQGTLEAKLLEQRFSSLCAVLGHQTIPPETLKSWLVAVEETHGQLYNGPRHQFGELLHDALWDKWSPMEFAPSTHAMLEQYFRERDLAWAAADYTEELLAARRAEYEEEGE